MNITVIDNIKKQYIEALSKDSKYNEVLKSLLSRKENEPISHFSSLNPEELPDKNKEERELQELLLDLTALNSGIVEIAARIDNIVSSVDYSMNTLKASIEIEEEESEDLEEIEEEPEQSNYLEELEKKNYYRNYLVNEYLEKGTLIDKAKLEEKLDAIDTKLSVFSQGYIEEGELLNIVKFNDQKHDLYIDLSILYKTLFRLAQERLSSIESRISTELTELNETAKYYKNREKLATLEIDSNALYYATNGFDQEYKDGQVTINLGQISIPSGSYIACLFNSDEVDSSNVIFRFDDNTQIADYIAGGKYLTIIGNYAINTEKIKKKESTTSSFTIDDAPKQNAIYNVFAGENKIKVKYEDLANIEYIDKEERIPLKLARDGEISFYVYGASTIRFSYKGEAEYKSFTGYEISSPEYRQKITINAKAGFELDIATDGVIYADKQSCVIDEESVICLVGYNGIDDFLLEEIEYGDDVVFDDVKVIVKNANTTFYDINYVTIKQCQILELDGDLE